MEHKVNLLQSRINKNQLILGHAPSAAHTLNQIPAFWPVYPGTMLATHSGVAGKVANLPPE